MDDFFQTELENLLSQTDQAEIFPVVTKFPADLLTPFGAYLKLAGESDFAFLFESVEGGENLARYSFLGADPVLIFEDNDGGTRLRTGGEVRFEKTEFYPFLREKLKRRKIATVPNLPSFIGGAVGFFDFAAVEHFEPVLREKDKFSEAEGGSQFAVYKTIIAFDHARQLINIITLVFAEDFRDKPEFAEKIEEARRKNRKVFQKLEQNALPKISKTQFEQSAEISSNWEKEDFKKAVSEIKNLIDAGECYQVVLSQCFSKKTDASAETIYRALRSLNPSPYMILLKLGEKSIIGASPEMLVRCRGNKLEYRPIAGTRPRGENESEDVRLAEEMRRDQKEISEHTMLVDLGRNDLGRVSKFGSVRVKNLMNVEKFSHVQHLVSYLFSELREDLDGFDALASCFPAGTVTGAPKVRAVQIIRALEPTRRGVYSGAVGYIDYAGNLDTCIAIRTLVLEKGLAKVQAGAGIVADSVPESEFQETVHKARGLFKAIDLAESGEYDI